MPFIQSLNLIEENTIADAFSAINGRVGMVVTVVDREDRLRGVVSEGDLRRAILSGNALTTPLNKIMNAAPVTISIQDLGNESKYNKVIDQIYQCYGSGGQGQYATIPIVDENLKVLGLIMPEMLYTREFLDISSGKNGAAKPYVLVVGGAGFIGSVCVRKLLAKGWRVRVLDSMMYRQKSLDDIKDDNFFLLRGDVTNINDIVGSIDDINAVVYLAELVGDAACAHRPERALKTNYLSVANIAHLCSYLNVNRFIYASSCSVYGGSKDPDKLLTEDSELNPISHYGRMKILAEQALMNMENPLFSPTILRLATVFGYSYRPRFDLVINSFAKNAFFKKEIEVFGGEQWRPNVHVGDVANAIITVLESPIDKVAGQIFNVGSISGNYRIKEIADLVLKIFPDTHLTHNSKTTDQRNYRVDFAKIEKAIGYRAKFCVIDGLKELKGVFERKEITNPDDPSYSNIEAIKEFVHK